MSNRRKHKKAAETATAIKAVINGNDFKLKTPKASLSRYISENLGNRPSRKAISLACKWAAYVEMKAEEGQELTPEFMQKALKEVGGGKFSAPFCAVAKNILIKFWTHGEMLRSIPSNTASNQDPWQLAA